MFRSLQLLQHGLTQGLGCTMRVKGMVIICLAITGCAGPDAFQRFASEAPPCRLHPLTEAQVHEIVLKAGKSTWIEGFPEPMWKVREYRCVYFYEQSAFYYKGRPVQLDTVDGSDIVIVSRGGYIL